jgi:kynurenine formamidase
MGTPQTRPPLVDYFKDVGSRLSNWGRWGPEDQRGTLNLITPEHLVAAARLIRRGQVFELGIPFGSSGLQFGGGHRVNPIHLMSMMPADLQLDDGAGFVDDLIIMPLQTATQWDGLAHCFYDERLYNGHATSNITAVAGASELGIHRLAGGVAGRGVLLDIARLKGVHTLAPSVAITPADLDAAERRQGVRVAAGDILLIRTGWRNVLTSSQRSRAPARQFTRQSLALPPEPGLSQQCCAWLHERHVAAIASDNYAIEVIPAEDGRATLPVHCILIRDMGMTLGELFDLEALASDCEAHGTWEFFFAAPPLKLTNGVGSPINPIAIA